MIRLARALGVLLLSLALVPAPIRATPPDVSGVALGAVDQESLAHFPPSSGTIEESRATGTDQPDGVSGPQTHIIYFVPKDRPDESLDTNGVIASSVSSMLDWFAKQMNRRPRMDRLQGGGSLDITFVAGELAGSAYTTLDTIATELRAKGFAKTDKRYFVYANIDRGNVCGEGSYQLPGVDGSGRYAALYLGSAQSCGARDFGGGSASSAGKAETTVAQEWLHNEGIVFPASPHHCASAPFHVCTGVLWLVPELDPENVDVLFPIVTGPLSGKVLDRGHDDYLDHPYQPLLPNLRDSRWLE